MEMSKIVEIVKRNINEEKMATELMMEVVFPQIDGLVQSSSNKIDDMLWPVAKEALKQAILDLLKPKA